MSFSPFDRSIRKELAAEVYSFSDYDVLIDEFENILKSVDIVIGKGTVLEKICLYIKCLQDLQSDYKAVAQYGDFKVTMREIVGFKDIVKKIVAVAKHKDFSQLIPHLHLLNKTHAAQNINTPATDQEANKLFELLIALLCLDMSENVKLDDPNNSKGNNPYVYQIGFGSKHVCSQFRFCWSKREFEGEE